ncbi:AAEL008313-PA [Aedes aegypti]|uniref:AAEL008313-PA n=1 Tax=Aedes aegypti TaxID=7159 RepID=Q16Z60_AEDAE|nr:AAEL008313-PA [Aedes aegypti]
MFQLVVLSALVVFGPIRIAQAQTSQEGCESASCSSFKNINTLYCHINKARFCQCRPGLGNAWVLQVMPCPDPETVFSFKHQVCVHPWMRDDRYCVTDSELLDDECVTAPCKTYEEINTLTCHLDRYQFCQCRPISTRPDNPNKGLFAGISMPCAKGTSFSFRQQTCVHDGLWVDSCPP